MNKSALNFVNSIGTIVTATVFLLFPVFFLTNTTDFFTFPKQILIIAASLALFILLGVKTIILRKVTLLVNPLNIPVLLFSGILILSTIFSHTPLDALMQSVPVILLGLFFLSTVNFLQDKSSLAIVVICLIIGSAVSALLSILANFNIFVLPFEAVRSTTFNTFGSPIQYLGYIVPVAILSIAIIVNALKKKGARSIGKDLPSVTGLIGGLVLIVGGAVVIYQIAMSPQKPILLPFDHGFQIAFASISQDSQRLAQSLLLGSGYGTFSSDFTRYVAPTFNNYPFWNLTFAFSSSYVLELLATTGVLGLAAYAYIFVNFIRSKARPSDPLFLATLSIFVISLLIPFSFALVYLLIALLSLFVANRGIQNTKGFDTTALNFVTLKQGLISLDEEDSNKSKENLLLPGIILGIALLTTVYVLFYVAGGNGSPRKGFVSLLQSDITFARSFSNTALASGTETYNLQTQALTEYPYRSDYYRLFSQINLALAANLVAAQENRQPTEEVQNNIIALLQQSINSARQSVTLSPYSALNWQNLGQIYRNLIGVGENAEQFAVASINQAILLNPSNPGLRIELGGIHYQLQQWDLAQNQFTVATQLKPDYANAYYNLGHVLEEKGDLSNALPQYQAVAQLVANDPTNKAKIDAEIKALQDKIGSQTQQNADQRTPTEDTTPLNVSQPQAEFPERDPRVAIPEPPEGQPTPTTTPAPSNNGQEIQ